MNRLFCGIAFLLSISQSAWSQEVQTFNAEISELNVMNKIGNVIINARPNMGTSSPIKVTFRKVGENNPKCKPIAKATGKVLDIGNDPTPDILAFCKMDIEIEMPSAMGVNVMVDADNGRAELHNVNSFTKLEMKILRGEVILDNSSFDDMQITIEESANVSVVSDSIEKVQIISKDGNISFKYLKLPSIGYAKFVANNGHIDVQVPLDTSITTQTELKSATTSGTVRPQDTKVSGSQHAIECQSPRGNIQIRRR